VKRAKFFKNRRATEKEEGIIFVKGKCKVVPVTFLTEHHTMKAY
jgi:hypothetical protein